MISNMNLPPEVDTIIVPQPTLIDTVSPEAKVAEKSRQCPICHVYYKYGNSYWQHVRYVHASFLSQCVICEKSYKRTTMAKHHILHSHKIAWHLCGNYVRKVKKSDLSLRKEIIPEIEKRNTNLKYFKKKTLHLVSCFNCYNCPGSFTTIDDLFEHVKSHRGKENFMYVDEEEDEDDVDNDEDDNDDEEEEEDRNEDDDEMHKNNDDEERDKNDDEEGDKNDVEDEHMDEKEEDDVNGEIPNGVIEKDEENNQEVENNTPENDNTVQENNNIETDKDTVSNPNNDSYTNETV